MDQATCPMPSISTPDATPRSFMALEGLTNGPTKSSRELLTLSVAPESQMTSKVFTLLLERTRSGTTEAVKQQPAQGGDGLGESGDGLGESKEPDGMSLRNLKCQSEARSMAICC